MIGYVVAAYVGYMFAKQACQAAPTYGTNPSGLNTGAPLSPTGGNALTQLLQAIGLQSQPTCPPGYIMGTPPGAQQPGCYRQMLVQ